MKNTEVFTPGAFPQFTYVETGEGLEDQLRNALATPGLVVSLVGPSKSGKTVLVEKVVGQDQLITITGAGIREPDEIWNRVLNWIGVPAGETKTSTIGGALTAESKVTTSASLLGFASGGLEGKAGVEISGDRSTASRYDRGGLDRVVKEIGGSEYVVLIDDFHYMHRDVQTETAKVLKEAVRRGVKVCTAAVRHRGDDLVRANPEIRGRVRAIDLKYWPTKDLQRIAELGFNKLNVDINESAINRLSQEAAGSPQLMQLLCLTATFVLVIPAAVDSRLKIVVDEALERRILEQTSANTDFRSLVDVLEAGPKTRGTERKVYQFIDDVQGDVYRCVLKAVAADPPSLSLKYDELLQRTVKVCKADSPVGSSVVGTCGQMTSLALEKFPNERAIDWDEQTQILDIPDPYLLFYLRWSGRLSEALKQ